MVVIPVQAVPAQTFGVQLGTQSCTITLFQTAYGMFCDLSVNGALVIGGVICQNLNRIVRDAYLGFIGDLCFVDQGGTEDPDYTGLGTRYLFCYLTPADLGGVG